MIKGYDRPGKPFEVNDRVFHEIFGEGYVEEIKVAANAQKYHVHVVFDESRKSRPNDYETNRRFLVSSFLTKIDAAKPDLDEKDPGTTND
jgi:hypothetical protein